MRKWPILFAIKMVSLQNFRYFNVASAPCTYHSTKPEKLRGNTILAYKKKKDPLNFGPPWQVTDIVYLS